MDVAFKRVGPGEEVPPPPKELAEWAGNTAGGTLGGMVYGAVRGYRAHDPRYAEVAAIVAKRHRWMRATSEATLGGLRLGSFVAVFSAVQLASASHRADGARDMWDTVAAGAVTAGATGLAIPGGVGVRMKGLGLGVLVGGGLCLPLGYVTQELDRLIPHDESRETKGSEPFETRTSAMSDGRLTSRGGGYYSRDAAPRDLAGAAIASFEAELRERAPRKKSTWFPRFRASGGDD